MFNPKPKTLAQLLKSDLNDAILDLHNQRLKLEMTTANVNMLTERVARLKIDHSEAQNSDDQTILEHSHRQL